MAMPVPTQAIDVVEIDGAGIGESRENDDDLLVSVGMTYRVTMYIHVGLRPITLTLTLTYDVSNCVQTPAVYFRHSQQLRIRDVREQIFRPNSLPFQ